MKSLPSALLHFFDFIVNPPPLEAMSHWQRFSRVILITTSLVVLSINVAIIGATFLCVLEWGRRIFVDDPRLEVGLLILTLGLIVNALSVCALLHVRRTDRQVLRKKPSSTEQQSGLQ